MSDSTTAAEQPRLDYATAFPEGLRAMMKLEGGVHASTLDPALLELVKMRASQINGCAFCLDMHSKDARARGESEQRLHTLPAWRETPFFTEPERAALAWCESLTRVAERGAPEGEYRALKEHFDDGEIAALTFAVVAINGWNRIAIGFGAPVGEYVSPYGSD